MMVGNHVSHSKRRVKRRFYPNLFVKRFYLPEEDRWVQLKVSAAGMRNINKKGLAVEAHGMLKTRKYNDKTYIDLNVKALWVESKGEMHEVILPDSKENGIGDRSEVVEEEPVLVGAK